MRRSILITTAAGALLATGLAIGPALAAPGPGNGPGSGPGNGNGPGNGYGPGNGTGTCRMTGGTGAGPGQGMGRGMGNGAGPGMGRGGMGVGLNNLPPQGTLTAAQKATLVWNAEEEKLSHDVYVALAKTSGDVRFTRIAAAETRHLTAVRTLLSRYGVADPTAGKAAGTFASSSFQKQYRDLVARGDDSLAAALAVGRGIEKDDVAALRTARSGLSAPDVVTVYTHLENASSRHLQAFGG